MYSAILNGLKRWSGPIIHRPGPQMWLICSGPFESHSINSVISSAPLDRYVSVSFPPCDATTLLSSSSSSRCWERSSSLCSNPRLSHPAHPKPFSSLAASSARSPQTLLPRSLSLSRTASTIVSSSDQTLISRYLIPSFLPPLPVLL